VLLDDPRAVGTSLRPDAPVVNGQPMPSLLEVML